MIFVLILSFFNKTEVVVGEGGTRFDIETF